MPISLTRALISSIKTTTTANPIRTMSTQAFFEAVETRRSYYNLTNKVSVSDARLQEIVEQAIKHTPSSFNTQTTRAVLVTGEKHTELWNAIWAAHKPALPNEEVVATFQAKFDGVYKPAYGTVVFFEDQDAVDAFIAKVPTAAGPFPTFTQNTAGIAQFITWTALATEGISANLQHYAQFSEANQKAIVEFLGVPEAWKCTALMPFGESADKAQVPPKTFAPIEDRVKVVA